MTKAGETKYGKYILNNSIVEGPVRRSVSSPYIATVGEFWKGLSGVNCNFAFSTLIFKFSFPSTSLLKPRLTRFTGDPAAA